MQEGGRNDQIALINMKKHSAFAIVCSNEDDFQKAVGQYCLYELCNVLMVFQA